MIAQVPTTDPHAFADYLRDLGYFGIAVAVLVLSYLNVWVWGRQLTACEKELAWWKDDDLKQREMTAKALGTGEKLAEALIALRSFREPRDG